MCVCVRAHACVCVCVCVYVWYYYSLNWGAEMHGRIESKSFHAKQKAVKYCGNVTIFLAVDIFSFLA